MFLRAFLLAVVVTFTLCLAAGGWRFPFFFAYSSVLWLSTGFIYSRAAPELVKERMKPPSDRDRRSRLISLPLMLGHYVVAGLDVGRFGWSVMPLAEQFFGLSLVVAGVGFMGWTLLSNPFASTAVRIQHERKHEVITTGPYALVRHPMYLGVLLFALGSGAALGSWWAGLFMVPLLLVFVRRTLFEDRMLHDELEGYPEYAKRVKWRVVPGLF